MTAISDEYEALEVIGKGSFGTVRKVRQRDNGAILVRKEIEYTSMNTQEKNHIISELRILRELNHPNIVKYHRHDHIPEKKAIHIYQEYCDGGDLGKIISAHKRSKEPIPEDFIWEILVQTLLALHRCHYGMDSGSVKLYSSASDCSEPTVDSETVIIHRDIKPENIFLLGPKRTVKLGDFGLAKMLTSQNDFAKTYVGTPYYMSPEVLMDNPYSPVCDIWSLGCVLFEMCNLHPPFQAKTHLQLQTKIKHGVIPEISPNYSQHLRNLIRVSITVSPDSRPTCFELLESVLVKMFRKEMELKKTNETLMAFQQQLMLKNEELKKREAAIRALDNKVSTLQDSERLDRARESKEKVELERREAALRNLETREVALAKREAALRNMEAKEMALAKREAVIESREESLRILERQVKTQRQELDLHASRQKRELEEDYRDLQNKCALHKKALEQELLEDFEHRKRLMDQEGEEMRLHYQREFRHVVEQEVNQRLAEILNKKSDVPVDLRRKKSDSSCSSIERQYRVQSPGKPKGPREMYDKKETHYSGPTGTNVPYQLPNIQHQHYGTTSPRRHPLGVRNDHEHELIKPTGRATPTAYKTRLTDEFERLNLQKRHVPEYEELYLRQNQRS